MGKEIDLGHGLGKVVEELAKISLKQQGKSLDHLEEEIQYWAEEGIDAYIPSPILGKNPRISDRLRQEVAPEIFSSNGLLAQIIKDPGQLKIAQIEIGGAVSGLSQAILRHAYGLKTTRGKLEKADLKNAKNLTPFEYVAKGSLSEAEIQSYNHEVDINRITRLILYSYIHAAVIAFIKTPRKEIKAALQRAGIQDADPKALRSEKMMKDITFFLHNRFTNTSDWFKNFNFSRLFSGARFSKKDQD